MIGLGVEIGLLECFVCWSMCFLRTAPAPLVALKLPLTRQPSFDLIHDEAQGHERGILRKTAQPASWLQMSFLGGKGPKLPEATIRKGRSFQPTPCSQCQTANGRLCCWFSFQIIQKEQNCAQTVTRRGNGSVPRYKSMPLQQIQYPSHPRFHSPLPKHPLRKTTKHGPAKPFISPPPFEARRKHDSRVLVYQEMTLLHGGSNKKPSGPKSNFEDPC